MSEPISLEMRLYGAIAELDAEHSPIWVAYGAVGYTDTPRNDLDPVGCRICYPGDGNWPCVSHMITDDLRVIAHQIFHKKGNE
jgi:hypothetical protein